MNKRGDLLILSGPIFPRLIPKHGNASAIQPKSPSPFLIVSSEPAPTKTTSYLMLSAVAVRPLLRRRTWGGNGLELISRPQPAASWRSGRSEEHTSELQSL